MPRLFSSIFIQQECQEMKKGRRKKKRNESLFLINPKLLGGPASGSLKITAFSYIQPSEPFLDLLTPASFTRKMRVLSQKCDACEILDLSAVT